MSYKKKLSNINNISFEKLRRISIKTLDKYSEKEREEFHYDLNSGISILKKNIHLHQYMYSYGKMHQAKLNFAFDKFVYQELDENKVEIIDYGAGQAFASFIFLEFIRDCKLDIKVKDITLIEPSKKALKRGLIHLESIDNSINVYTINKEINNLTLDDLATKHKKIKLHLFSNIIDLDSFKLNKLFNKIVETQENINYFVCISPYNDGSGRINKFYKKFKKNNLNILSSCNYNWVKGDWENNWTNKTRIFTVDL